MKTLPFHRPGIPPAASLALLLVLLSASRLAASDSTADPHVTSWLTTYSARYARIYTNDTMRAAGDSLTTWSNGSETQSVPAYAGVQAIYSSTNAFYVRTTGLASHIMGPWMNGNFPNLPENKKAFWRFPLETSVPASKTLTPGGTIGLFVDGVAMYDSRDAFSWNGSTEVMGPGYWNRDAFVNEAVSFDPAFAHQDQSGTHHYHASPIAVRYQLGDHVDFDPATGSYSESTNAVTRHSPILAWVADGHPLYGPYGYSSASNSVSGVRRMISGYVLRNGQSGTSNLAVTGRGALPQWAVRLYNVASNALAGPNVSTTYPLGRYMEDKDYLGDLGHTQGVDFDLDVYNGRWCVTPEFPNGTYAYFVSIAADGTPVFPYNIGRAYYGDPTGGSVSTFPETVITNFLGGPNTPASLDQPVVSGGDVVLAWSGVEGGTYVVQAEQSLTNANWLALGSNIVGSTGTASTVETNGAGSATRFYRLLRADLAAYDPADASGGGTVTNSLPAPGGSVSRGHGTNVTITITLPANPPLPPAGVNPSTVTLAGTIKGTAVSRPTQGTVVASFAIPATAPTGAQDIVIEFNPAPTYSMSSAFTINP